MPRRGKKAPAKRKGGRRKYANQFNKRSRPKTKKRRNFEDPRYIEWRKAVYERDEFKCCVCDSKDAIEAHHIKMWAKYPERRFLVSNGITLCHRHHKMTLGFEEQYEFMFYRLLAGRDR
jgi:predicted restriction endonuclease